VPLKRRAAPRAEIMGWDGSKWVKVISDAASGNAIRVRIRHGTIDIGSIGTDADAKSNDIYALKTGAFLSAFNGTTWDRWRNNTEKTVLPSAARTSSGNSADQVNYNARGVIVNIDVTAVSGAFATGEGLHVVVSGKDPTSGRYFWLSPRIGPYTTTGHRQILVYPGCTDIAGWIEGKNDVPLTRTWRIHYDITGTNPSFTFSVGAMYIV